MRSKSRSTAVAALVGAASAGAVLAGATLVGTTSAAFATADEDPVVLVHQDGDGSLWYDWYTGPANKIFLTAAHPCWVDHDHIRLGAQNRDGCSVTRP